MQLNLQYVWQKLFISWKPWAKNRPSLLYAFMWGTPYVSHVMIVSDPELGLQEKRNKVEKRNKNKQVGN